MVTGLESARVPVDDLVATIDAAQREWADHIRWLLAWHRALLEHTDGAGAASDPGCALGGWLLDGPPEAVEDLPELTTLRDAHERMHLGARELLERTGPGGPVPEDGYAHVMALLEALADAMRRFQNALLGCVADVDPLTGLHNRTSSETVIDVERARHLRTGQPCAVVVMDLDDFGAVNERSGRHRGDAVLRSVAELLDHLTRPYDWAFRVGGDQFLLCLPDTRPEQAAAVCERIRTALDRGVSCDGGPLVRLTASFGVAGFEEDESVDSIEARADAALQRCQRRGGNAVELDRTT